MKERKNKNPKEILEVLAKNLFSLLGLVVEFSVTQENDFYLVNLKTETEAGLLIGRQGENVDALKTFFQLALKQATGEWYHVKVNVGDWLERQEEYLKSLAEKTARKAKETNSPQYLYNLSADQRRIIHLTVANIEGVKSESLGEGKERYLVISPDESKKEASLGEK
jgi:spoIIIJ-associated protein